MDEAERTRTLEAMAAAMADDGAGATVAEATARAGVSGAAFAAEFSDREACVLATFDLGVERARARMVAAYDLERRWLDGVKAALATFLSFLEDEPALGRVLIVHSMSAGELVMRRRMQILDELASVVDRGRLEGPAGRQQPPAVIAQGVIGAVVAIVQNRMVEHCGEPLMDLYGSLVSVVVLPYFGASVAHRELTRPMPRIRDYPTGQPGGADAGEPYGFVRFTYRTARVLGVIADYPGASNREVADRAGVVDQGQISKLLSRLEGRRLIEKIGQGGTARGAPNSWRLTEHGERVLRTVQMA